MLTSLQGLVNLFKVFLKKYKANPLLLCVVPYMCVRACVCVGGGSVCLCACVYACLSCPDCPHVQERNGAARFHSVGSVFSIS